MAIRYDKTLNKEINRVVKNFNNKVKRLEQSERDLMLPAKVTIKELKDEFRTRRELYRELEKLKRYSKRGIEETIITMGGAKISKYELENIKREARRIKYQVSRQITLKKITKPRVFGKEQDVSFAQMGDRTYLNLKARRKALNKKIEKLSLSELKRFENLLEKSRRKRFYDFNNLQYNWANEMLIPLAYLTNYPIDKLEGVAQKIATLREKDFLDLFNNEMVMRAITEFYAEAKRGNTQMADDVKPILDELINNIDDLIADYE